jgi:hypothetical protein
MKRFIVLSLAILIATSSLSMAKQGGMSMHKGMGMGQNGMGMHKGMDMGQQPAITPEEAKVKAETFVSEDLQGYAIADSTEQQTRRGTMFVYTLTKGDKELRLVIGPMGHIRVMEMGF